MLDREDVMTCPNFRRGTCQKSDPTILEEDALYVQVGCRTCRGGWVVTLPEGQKKARYENRIAELKRREQERKQRESKRVIFA